MQIQQQLTLVTQEIAAERKLDIVLAKATIVLVRPELELTDAALALLNQRLPRVQLPELERQ
jgi:Skp family chaperone for outer membrane proteins